MIRFGCMKKVGDFEIFGVLCSGKVTLNDSLTGEMISNEPFISVREHRTGIDFWESKISLNGVENFISQIEGGEGTIETEEENIKIYETEEVIHEIRDLSQRLSSIRLEKKKNCLVVDGHDLRDVSTGRGKDYNEKRIISKNDSLTRVIIFGGLCISTELVIENAVDFRELMCDKYEELIGRPCHACKSLKGNMKRVDNDYTHGNTYYVCDECLKEITLKCAEISGNKKVENDVIANSI